MYYRKIFQAEGKICTYRVLEMKKTIACSGEYFLNQLYQIFLPITLEFVVIPNVVVLNWTDELLNSKFMITSILSK